MTLSLNRDDVLSPISQNLPDGRREAMLHIPNMHCGACVRRIQSSLSDTRLQFQADVPSASAILRWDPKQHSLSELLERLDDCGFPATTLADDNHYRQLQQKQRNALARMGVALLFGMQVMMLASGEYLGHVDSHMQPLLRHAQWLLATPVLLYAGWPFLQQGISGLLQLRPSMDTPVALAMLGAYGLSAWNTAHSTGLIYFDSVAMFVLLLAIARHMQDRGHLRAADRLRRLSASQPATAQREHTEGLELVPCSLLNTGDIVVVAPGAPCPADGILLQTAELDESLLTGESLPQARQAQTTALAGSINVGVNSLRLQVQHSGNNTQLSQIARIASRAQMQRPVFAGMTELVARYFVALVLILAGITAWIWRGDPEQAVAAVLAMLVVTCPCALSLAAPTALATAATRLGRAGILLVNSAALLRVNRISDVCLDKTGTLTTRQLRIAKIELSAEHSKSECLHLAAALEAGLQHPIALAFQSDQAVATAQHREVLTGRGVRGQIEGRCWSLVNEDQQDQLTDYRWFALQDEQHNTVARFALSESLRDSAPQAMAALRDQGLDLHVLTGDPSAQAAQVLRPLNPLHLRQTLQAQDKLNYIRDIQQRGGAVLVAGDGINDAPFLSGADIAVGLASGSAMAQSAGDMILVNDDLNGIAKLLATGKLTLQIIQQNFAWALAYNLTMVPVAMLGYLTPWAAALGMGASSLLVTLNALRLLGRDAADPAPSVAPAKELAA